MYQQKEITNVLEGNKNLKTTQNVDINILKEADKYAIDVDSLESFNESKIMKIVQKRKEEETWRKLDINLSDIINMVIATSERPMFLIRDDKVVYLNSAAMNLLDVGVDKDVLGGKFLNLVAKDDWNLLAENIGEMLTNAKTLKIRLKSLVGKIIPMNFQAIYLSEIEHFSFILVGEHTKKIVKSTFNNLYDDLTGLPNFFLFEDRVQVAVTQENLKENVRDKNLLVVIAINIDNIESFRKMHIEDMVVKKMASNLILNLPKTATVALGLKYNFWVLLPGIKNKAEANHEIRRITEILYEGVSDNFTRHELLFSVGVSLFPHPAHSAKKLIEQAIAATKKAQENPKSSVEIYISDDV